MIGYRLSLRDVLSMTLAQTRAFRNEGRPPRVGVKIESDDDIPRMAAHWDRWLVDEIGALR